jgi:SNF2 family DNA or RNA helicase
MLDFATDYQNTLGQNIINVPHIKEHMYKNFFRRNTKKSKEDEFKLPDLREKIVWLRFTQTERMMYNAYLSDPNVNRFSEIVRQICCHPKIADEIKGILSNCKTLSDVENTMVRHYKQQYLIAQKTVNKCKKYIAKTERRILIAECKRQRKFLKQKGYKVIIDLPKFEFVGDLDESPNDILELNIELADDADPDDTENGADLDLDDLSEDSDDDKPVFTITGTNQSDIFKLIKKQLDANPSLTINAYQDTLAQQKERLVNASKIYDGKKASYDFFNNMLQRIKKFTEKSKAKYDKFMLKQKQREEAEEAGNDYDSDSDSDDEDDSDEDNCGICMCEISGEDVGVTKCGHIFCYECLKATIHSANKCPICLMPQSLKDISMISFEKPVFTKENSQILKNKMELIDKVGTKLTNLIYYLNSIPDHVIIFSQWDSLLRKVGDVLEEHGIPTVYCKGNVWSRDKAIREFSSDDKIKVILLSSESAASGTNLTKASKVILLDPVSGAYEYRRNMEWQAIGRAYRLGQTKSVEIVRFIIKDTVEEEIYKDNKIEDMKQQTQLNISEILDETITLSDDKLRSIAEAVSIAKELKEKKLKEKKERQEKLKEKLQNNLKEKKLTKIVGKNVKPAIKKVIKK